MSRFFTHRLDKLTPYTPGEQPRDMQYIKLNTNESPYPPSPAVIEAAKAEVQRQLEIAAAGEFSDELIEEARLAFQNAYRSILSSLGSLERHWVTEVIVGTNASPQQKAEAMEAVTKEQICAVAKSCWTDTVYLLAPNQEAGKEN